MQRADVAEELDRLEIHIVEARKNLAATRSARPPPGLSAAGTESRSEHARVEVDAGRDGATRGRPQGHHRTDPRTGSEHRMTGEPVEPGLLLVVSAPSGAGKTSLVNALVSNDENIRVSVSHTTRARRGNEREGENYFFIDRAQFAAMVAAGAFLEHATVFGNSYGTSRATVERELAVRPRRFARDRLAGRAADPALLSRRGVAVHPAAVAPGAERTAAPPRRGQRRGDRQAHRGGRHRDVAPRRVRLPHRERPLRRCRGRPSRHHPGRAPAQPRGRRGAARQLLHDLLSHGKPIQ